MNLDEIQPAAPSLSPEQLIKLARGFSKLFWGIPLAILLFIGFVSLNFLVGFRVPSYVIGLLLMYWGFLLLYTAKIEMKVWKRLVYLGFLTVFVQIYLSPFVFWWKELPHINYFTTHVFALLFFMSWALLLVNQLAAQLAAMYRDPSFRIESQICGWLVVGLMFLPMSFYFSYSLYASVRNSTTLFTEISQIHYELPGWIQGLFLLPFTLTMAISWKAKEHCFTVLRQQAEQVHRDG